MSRYRQTFTEAMQLVALTEKEVSKLKNGVKVLGNALPNRAMAQKAADKANKEMGHDADVYQSPFNNRFYVRIKEETILEFTDAQIKQAYGILNDPRYKQGNYSGAVKVIDKIAPGLSKQPDVANALKRANEELEESFSDAQIKQLQKEYEPLRGKKISIDNANKLGAMFTKFDSNKNALEKLYGGNIPFVSTMAMTRLMTKHNYTASKINALRKEELEILEEVDIILEGQGTIKGFRNDKEKSNMVSLAKQHGLKVSDVPGGIQLSGNMRKILDMQLASGSHLKTESVEYVEYMAKNSGQASTIANMFKGKTGGGEIHKSGSEVRIDSAKNIESIHKQVVAKFPDTNVMTVEDADLEEGMMSKIDAMQKDGKSAADIAKELKLKVSVVKGILGEELDEMKKDDAYAIGMAQAKKSMNDEPPLEKKTIKKGHEIAKKVLDKEGFASDAQRKAAFANGYKEKGKMKKENAEHPAKAMYEQIAGLKKKSEKSGMPYGILKKVYDRGMAAWRGGHRPGTTQQQWAFARVNSFITKSSGTWGGADKDLAAKVKGSK